MMHQAMQLCAHVEWGRGGQYVSCAALDPTTEILTCPGKIMRHQRLDFEDIENTVFDEKYHRSDAEVTLQLQCSLCVGSTLTSLTTFFCFLCFLTKFFCFLRRRLN